MNKKTKYYYLVKGIIVSTILIVVLSLLKSILGVYREYLPVVFDTLIIIVRVFNTLSIISLIVLVILLGYQTSLYLKSRFYKNFSISFFEAIYHGFMDIHLVYDQLYLINGIKDISVDMRNGMITFNKERTHYCFIFLEVFGMIKNKSDNEMWAIFSKPKKEFGRKRYTKKLRFPNPVRELDEYIAEQTDLEGKEVVGYVVLNGLFKTDETNDKVILSYEVTSVIK